MVSAPSRISFNPSLTFVAPSFVVLQKYILTAAWSETSTIRGFTVTHNAIRVGEVPVNDVTFVDCCQVLDTSLQRSPDYEKVR